MSELIGGHRGTDRRDRVPVAIVGGGPVGLSLALGLAHHGVRSVLVEKKVRTDARSRAPGIHLRTREILRRWGVEERLLAEGTLRESVELHTRSGRSLVSIDYSILDSEADRPGVLFLEQAQTEQVLLDAVRASGLCEVRFATEAVELEQDAERAVLTCRDGESLRTVEADFVVGCDGAKSFTRRALCLPFEGSTYSIRAMLVDLRVDDDRDALPWPRIWNGSGGLTVAAHLPDGAWRLMHMERGRPDHDEEVGKPEVEQHMRRTLGAGAFEVEWASQFRLHQRAAPTYRVGRALLAGDAAHVHSPAGGLGMNAGIQDAHNLCWKLVTALHGGDAERLLASYDVERRSVTAKDVTRQADLMTRGFLQTPAALRMPLFWAVRRMLAVAPIRRALLRRMTMIALAYDKSPLLRPGCSAVGARLPNPLIARADGSRARLYDIASDEPFLIHVADRRREAVDTPLEVIRVGVDGYDEPAGLLRRITGGQEGYILVRPDLHIAWVGQDHDDLDEIVQMALGTHPSAIIEPVGQQGRAR
ncbi:NAD(P)/FAD-dependent oxidoreductase [Brachybacterium sp. P6-10-X1]|uniref:FAD-dependent oxidoreductase n=1 Tax=Brachybacterium sp. P6-10-X1 TaxID=1903186 RepID=UPI0015602F63|nr:FAD-dependent monooxygenase [Brachybacterium sp. P6-10-X1]